MNFFLGTSVKFLDRISLGITMNYLMGKLNRERQVDFPMNPGAYSKVSSIEEFNLRKSVFSLGLQYKETFNDQFFLSLGGIYDLAADANVDQVYSVLNQIYPGSNSIVLNDSVTVNPEYPLGQDTIVGGFTIPQKIGVGLALGIPDKLIFTADYTMQDWTGTRSEINYRTTDASSFNVGLEYTPDREALRGYHNYISYRLGGYYSESYLSVRKPDPGTVPGDEFYQMKDYGITFGVGMPVRSMRTSINVSFTLGTRGTMEYNLIEENYGIITFNVTLHDVWFRKRRFD
jgi:hypothetical protein